MKNIYVFYFNEKKKNYSRCHLICYPFWMGLSGAQG